MIAPCKDCEKRTAECHGKCPEYAEYAEWMKGIRAKRHEIAEAIDGAAAGKRRTTSDKRWRRRK